MSTEETQMNVVENFEFYNVDVVVKMGKTPIRIGEHHPPYEIVLTNKHKKPRTIAVSVAIESQDLNASPIDVKKFKLLTNETQTITTGHHVSNNADDLKDGLFIAFAGEISGGLFVLQLLVWGFVGALFFFLPGKITNKIAKKWEPKKQEDKTYEFTRV